MRAGLLRRVIDIEQRTFTQDLYGEPQETWTLWKRVRASVSPMRGREYMMGQAQEASIDTKIRIRYVPGILQDRMRVKHGAEIFDIDSVVHVDERREMMELMCRRQI